MAAPASKKPNTQFGQPLLFTGYAGGDLFSSKPTLLSDRFLYVIEKRPHAPAKLHLELQAFANGDLKAAPPDRRSRERDPHNRDLFPVRSPIPWSVQGQPIKYFFFASPTRLLQRAITALEWASVTFPDGWVDFSQPLPGRYFVHVDRPPVLVVIDPLTIATKLHSDYERALDEQLLYLVPCDEASKEADTIRERILKYQLATLMDRYLLPGGKDPYNVLKEFADKSGDVMRNYIKQFETKKQSLDAAVDSTAALLVAQLESPYWSLLASLHTYSKEDNADWLELQGPLLTRLSCSDRGKRFLGQLFSQPPSWMAATGITGAPLPPEGADEEEAETLAFVTRKAAAGVSEIWVEVLPAAIALGKTSVADALDRIDRVYRRVKHTHRTFRHIVRRHSEEFGLSFQRWFTKKPVDKGALHKEIAGLKDWIEEGTPRWPKESEGARTARALSNVLRAVQLINLAIKIVEASDRNKDNRFQANCEVAVAVLDTIESFEEVFMPALEKVVPKKVAGATFKFMGGAAGLVHVGLALYERGEAERDGKRDLVRRSRAELTIYGLEAIGGTGQGMILLLAREEAAQSALVLALDAVASALCFASFAGAVVYTLWAEGKKKSAFQRFVNHSVFGSNDDEREQAIWASGRWFSSWRKQQPGGLRRQRETLNMLLANFSVVGTDRYAVDIRLGATPPGMKLKVTFTLGDQEFPSSPSHRSEIRAHAVIDPFATGKWADPIVYADGEVIWETHVKTIKGSTTVHVGARPKGRRVECSTEYCHCDAQLVFESETPSNWEVAIPPEKPLHYVLMDGGTPRGSSVKSSLPDPD